MQRNDDFYQLAAEYGYPQRLDALTNYDEILKRVQLLPSDLCIDIGCGAGGLMKHIQQSCACWGVDLNFNILSQGALLSGVNADGLSLPFRDESFTHAFLCRALSVLHAPTSLRECWRCLKRQSEVHVIEYESPIYWSQVIDDVWQCFTGKRRVAYSLAPVQSLLGEAQFHNIVISAYSDYLAYPSRKDLVERFLYYSPLQRLLTTGSSTQLQECVESAVNAIYQSDNSMKIEWTIYTGVK